MSRPHSEAAGAAPAWTQAPLPALVAPARPWRRRKATPVIGLATLSGTLNDAAAVASFGQLQRLLAEPRPLAGLVLRIASPGGSLAVAQALVEQLVQLRAEARVPVVTVVDDIAASAAFYLALHGDRLFAQPAALLGSVGAQVQRFDVSGLLERLGVNDVSICSSPAKRALETLQTDASAEADGPAASLVADIHEQFVAVVQARPGARLEPDMLRGALFTGRRAHGCGLVDELGGTPAAVAWIARQRQLDRFEMLGLERGPQLDLLGLLLPNLPRHGLIGRLLGRG